MRTSKLRTLALAFGSLVVFVLLAEAVVRLAGPDLSIPKRTRFRYDPRFQQEAPTHARDDRLGWRLNPSSSDHGIVTNSHGFRGREFSLEKPPGVFRIVFVGDSNAMGYGVADEDSIYSSVVEKCLAQGTSRRVEAINMGVDAYSSHQVRILLEMYLPTLAADVVCVQVGFNDFLTSSIADRNYTHKRLALFNALETSHAYRWFRRVVLRLVPRRSPEPVPRVSLQEFEANLRDMVTRCRSAGAIPILIATWPRPHIPIAIREVQIEEGGRTQWVTQRRWAFRRLADAGIDPPRNPHHPDFLRVIEGACREHPDWSTLHFLRAQGLLAAGRLEEAERARVHAVALEKDRAVFERYLEVQRRLGMQEGVRVFDVESALAPHLAGKPMMTAVGLFTDFIHLGAEGHALVGGALCEVIEEVLAESG